MVAHAVFLKAALVHAGGHDERIRRRHDAKIALRIAGVFNSDTPVAAVALFSHDEHIAAEVERRRGDALFFKLRAQKIRRVALCDAAEVELRAAGECDQIAVRRFFERDLVAPRAGKQRRQFIRGRHAA